MKILKLLIIIPNLVFGGVTVHLGIIDEEIAAVLPALIEEVPPRQVVFIERESAPFENLPLGSHWKRLIDIPPQLVQDDSWLPKKIEALGLNIPFLPSKLDKSQNLNIYVFHSNIKPENTAYVVRLPEMGLQPGLVGPTLKSVLRPIVAHEAENNGSVTVALLGAGGAVDTALQPGDTAELAASLYLGVDLVEMQGKQKFLAKVELHVDAPYSTQKGPLLLFEGKPISMETSVPAEQRRAYKEAREQLDHEIQKLLNTPNELAELRSIFNQIRSSSGKEISISTSFFAGAPVKELGMELGVHNVNMEDSHIIAVVNMLRDEFPTVSIPAMRLARQVEDPASISPELNEKFLSLLIGESYPPIGYPQYSRSAYVEAIIWGNLQRFDYDHLPLDGDWKFAWKHIKEDPEQIKHFYVFEMKGEKKILDPFFNEIAGDMLPEMARGNFLTPYMIDIEVHNQLKKKQLTAVLLSEQLALTNAKISKAAKTLLSNASRLRSGNYGSNELDFFRLQVLAVLDEIDYIGGDKSPLIPLESLPEAYQALLTDPILKEHFVPSLLGPRDIQAQLGYREIPSELNEVIVKHMDHLRDLSPIHSDLLPSMKEETRLMAKEHLDLINNQILLRMHALYQSSPPSIDLYVLVNLVFKAQYPLPRVGFFVKSQQSLDDGYLDVWTRPAKWDGNLTGLLNHLPYDYLVSDSNMASDSDTMLLRSVHKILEEVHLQDSIFDRALYKSAIGPALMAEGVHHLKPKNKS